MKIKKPLLGLLVCASALLSVDKAYAATASVSEDANLRSDPLFMRSAAANVSITEAIAIARRYIGYPYVWGGNGPDAYDCSGFTKMLYAKMGKAIPRTSYAQYSNCQKVSKSN